MLSDASAIRLLLMPVKRDRIDVLMFHRHADRIRWRGAALERLRWHQREGRIGAIGVSVYTRRSDRVSSGDPQVTHLQIPFNLLDNRWLRSPFQTALAARPEVRIHVRSVFLQGLLLGDAGIWPACFSDAQELVLRIEELMRRFGRSSRADLCLAYVRAFPWIFAVLVGVETAEQLDELLPLMRSSPLSAQQVDAVQNGFSDIPDRLLSPANWNSK